MVAVDRDLQQFDAAQTETTLAEVDSKANAIMKTLFNVVSDVDLEAAAERVKKLKKKYPEALPSELSQMLIRDKCQRTGTVGAVTSGTGLVPGLGTATAVTLGVATDIGATFKLQAELVLEIASVYDYPLTEQEKQQLVMLITGLSAGTSVLTRRAGQAVAVKIGEKVAARAVRKTVLKALPVVGVIASAGTNVLSTYVIGQRADAYFRLGPEAVGSWGDSLRTITGMDERNIARWLAEGGKATGAALALGAGKAGQAGKAAGEAVVAGAGRVAETVGTGTQKAGQTAQAGIRAYLRWVVTVWKTVFRIVGKIQEFVWAVITFIPRKITGRFRRKKDKLPDKV
jgi:hypothetical protein